MPFPKNKSMLICPVLDYFESKFNFEEIYMQTERADFRMIRISFSRNTKMLKIIQEYRKNPLIGQRNLYGWSPIVPMDFSNFAMSSS